MKKIILIFNLFIFCLFGISFGQTISPDQTYKVWGGEIVEYTRGPFDNCKIDWQVSKGVFPDDQNGTNTFPEKHITKVKVKWNNEPTTIGRITFKRSDCNTTSNNSTERNHYNFAIMSLIGFQVSNVSISSPIPVCGASARTFSISKTAIPNSANSKFASGYEWTIPAGWTGPTGQTGTFLISDPNAFSVSLTPSACASGAEIVRVRAYTNTEGKGTPHFSNLSNPLTVVRNSSPEISIPSDLKCGVPFTASVPTLSCASGYNWSVPSGWAISGSGAVRTITPNGTTGTISVTIPITGGCSVTASNNVSTTFNPTINGPATVCISGTIFQLIDVPAGITSSWSISSPSLFIQGSGIGINASITPINAFVSGQFILTFNVSGVCGSETKTRTITVGKPEIPTITILGISPYGAIHARANGNHNPPYKWYVNGSHVYTTHSFNEELFIPGGSCGTTRLLSVSTSNSCGESFSESRPEHFYTVPCFSYNMYPNPVTDELNIEQDFENKVTTEEETSYEVKIFDGNGNEFHSQKSSKKTIKIDVRKLKPGFYYVHIIQKDGIIRKQIKIER